MNRLTKWTLIFSFSLNIALAILTALSFLSYHRYLNSIKPKLKPLFTTPHPFLFNFNLHSKNQNKKEFIRKIYREYPHLLELFAQTHSIKNDSIKILTQKNFDRKKSLDALKKFQLHREKTYLALYPPLLKWLESLPYQDRKRYIKQTFRKHHNNIKCPPLPPR